MIGEEWRVVSVNNAYEVSNLGRLRRIDTGRISKAAPRRAGHFANVGNNSPRGEQSPHSKLTLNDVLAIRKLSERGISNKRLADKFNISNVQIKNIVLRRSWATA